MSRRGFTLVEMLITAAVSGVILLALATLFLGSDNLIGGIRQDVRGSLQERTERDRALFDPARTGRVYSLPGKEDSP